MFCRDALIYFNECSLEDSDFGANFALLFTSRYFDDLKEHLKASDGNCMIRSQILNMLQKNYSSEWRKHLADANERT